MVDKASGILYLEKEREYVGQLARMLRNRVGLDYSGERMTLFTFTLQQRMRRLGIASVAEYIVYLQGHAEEWQALVNAVSVLETSFFRQSEYFRMIVEYVLPTIHRTYRPGRAIHMWSVATATGEEAYTLAMAAWEAGVAHHRPVIVWATDINTDALNIARQARYAEMRIRHLPQTWVQKYLIRNEDGTYSPREEIRRLVRFRTYNLVDLLSGSLPFPAIRLDVIYCTNVLIYFNRRTTQDLIHALADLLSDEGVLFLDRAITYLTRDVLQRVRWQNAVAFRALTHASSRKKAPPPPRREARPRNPKRLRHDQGRNASPPQDKKRNSTVSFAHIQRLVNMNRLDEAEDLLHHWLDKHPGDYRAHFLIGRLYQMKDDVENARYHYQRALFLHPTLSVAYLELGNLHRRRGEVHHARREYRRAADIAEQDNASIYFGFSPKLVRRLALKALHDLKPRPRQTSRSLGR